MEGACAVEFGGRVDHSAKSRRVAWYDPCEPVALDALLRAACGIAPDRQYLLLDATMAPVAVSSSLPSGETFELVRVVAGDRATGCRLTCAHGARSLARRCRFRLRRTSPPRPPLS